MKTYMPNIFLRLTTAIVVLFFAATTASATVKFTISGKVVSVLDGDTVEVLVAKRPYRIRLYGIDCPEKGQAFGDKARAFTSAQLFGKEVEVRVVDVDRYGRYVGEIIQADGSIVNLAILRAGFAWWYSQFSKDELYRQAEAAARSEQAGLWADAHPEPPWQFRRERKESRKR